jgi:hypothetical protein
MFRRPLPREFWIYALSVVVSEVACDIVFDPAHPFFVISLAWLLLMALLAMGSGVAWGLLLGWHFLVLAAAGNELVGEGWSALALVALLSNLISFRLLLTPELQEQSAR